MSLILETPRLFLREFVLEDAEEVLELHSNPEVQKYTGQPNVTSVNEVEKTIRETWVREYKKYGFARWATIHKGNNRFIGWAGLKYLPEFDAIDLGYRFIPEYWGQGIATEISLAIIKYGFESLNLQRIIGIAMLENRASIKVLEKSGLTFDKLARYEAGNPLEVAWYSLEKDKYFQTTSLAPK